MSISSSCSQMLQLPSFSVLFTFLLFLCMLIRCFKKYKASPIHKLPPGPPKLPFIGNLHQLVDPLPHQSIRKLVQKYGPVMDLQLGEQFVVVVSSPDVAKEVFKAKELTFVERPQLFGVDIMAFDNPSRIVFAPYGDYWRQLKKTCVYELLSMKRVQSFRSIREEEVYDLLMSISSRRENPVNLSEMIFSMLNDITCRAALGKKCKDQGEFISLLGETMRTIGGFNLPDLYPSLKFLPYITSTESTLRRIKKRLDKILEEIIVEHREKRRCAGPNGELHQEDFIDVLLRLQESNQLEIPLSTNQIKAAVMDMISAGSETSATSLEWTIAELVKNPKAMEKAQAEVREAGKGKAKIGEADIKGLPYLQLVIKETFRMHPPGPLIPRESTQKCDISGYEIPAKARILFNTWAIGRDPDIWTEPEKFMPERFQGCPIDFKGTNFELTPFGAGRRICPGITYATATIELALAQLLYHFDWKLPNGMESEALDMTEAFGITSRKKHNLHLIATVHVPVGK